MSPRVLITRPASRAGEWIAAFRSRGFEVVHHPVFALVLPAAEENERTLAAVAECAARPAPWVAFTSVAALEHLFDILACGGEEERIAGRFRVAAVGPGTRRAADERGLSVELVAAEATGERLARDLLAVERTPDVLHPVSSKGRVDFDDAVRAGGGRVWRVIVSVHERAPGGAATESALADLERTSLDLLTFASPSAVAGLIESASPALAERWRALPALALGPTTERALIDEGFRRVRCAATPALEDVLSCAVELLREQ